MQNMIRAKLPAFHFFEKKDHTDRSWSSFTGPMLQQIFHFFDLSMMFGMEINFIHHSLPGEDGLEPSPGKLKVGRRLFWLWAAVLVPGLQRNIGQPGHLEPNHLLALFLLFVQLFTDFYGTTPTSVSHGSCLALIAQHYCHTIWHIADWLSKLEENGIGNNAVR